MRKMLLLLVFLFLFCDRYIFAHGDLHERILKVSEQVKISPDSADLYLKRGKLYYQNESYKKSIKDLISSKRLGYNSAEQKLLFAKSYFKLEEYENSLVYYKLSELYILNNNTNKALENLTLAKEQFYSLPARLQNTPFMKELINNIKLKEILLQTK